MVKVAAAAAMRSVPVGARPAHGVDRSARPAGRVRALRLDEPEPARRRNVTGQPVSAPCVAPHVEVPAVCPPSLAGRLLEPGQVIELLGRRVVLRSVSVRDRAVTWAPEGLRGKAAKEAETLSALDYLHRYGSWPVAAGSV